MAITFTRAPTLAPGDPVTSTQIAKLAAAFNDRLRSGLGDPSYRLAFYHLNLFRQLRNPSGWLWPSQVEFFRAYQMLRPTQGEWPLTGPGDPEGTNVNNPLGAYVFGNEAADLPAEEDRLTSPAAGGIPLRLDGRAPASPLDYWTLGKLQRGAWDPATGAIASPAFTAARSWAGIRYTRLAPYGNSYGSWLPMPEILGTACDDPDTTDDYPPPINYEIKFSALTAGLSDITYPGTCVPGPSISPADKYDGHVAAVFAFQWAYYVFVYDSTDPTGYHVDVLSTQDYLEGPYTGAPKLGKREGQHLPRVLNAFIRDFRGAWAGQIPEPPPGAPPSGDPPHWLRHAADIQRFLRSQYLLAPARGIEAPPGQVSASYPSWTFHPASTSTAHTLHPDCCLSAIFLQVANPEHPIRLDIVGPEAHLTYTFPAGDTIQVLPTPLTGTVAITCRPNTATVHLELIEQMTYKPDTCDLFLLLRSSAAIM